MAPPDFGDADVHVTGAGNASRAVPVIDGLLAATSKVHRMTLVTRNKMDPVGLDVELFNPFEADCGAVCCPSPRWVTLNGQPLPAGT